MISSNLTCHAALDQPSEEELEFLRHLYTSDYERHKNRNPERTPGTCEWVFNHSQYLNWNLKNSSSLLWVSADPGCGKSVLASFLVDKFKSFEFQEVVPSTVCFFFFKDDSDEQNNAVSAVSSILHQLFSAAPELITLALKQYNTKGKKLFGELGSLWNIFMSAATDANSKKVICIIDGIDECQNPSRNELFQLLGGFCAESIRQSEERTHLKILLLSRPYTFIEDALHHPLTIRMKMEDHNDLTCADIKLVIRNRVVKFGSSKNISEQVQTRLIDRLINDAGQTFLWVSLVLADIESSLRASEAKLLEQISQIPTNLNAIYEKILGKSPSPKDARKILFIILGAVRPLSLEEMNIAFVIKSEDRKYDDLDFEPAIEMTVRNLCGLFVKVIDSKIYFVHQTAREFLVKIDSPQPGGLNAWQNSLDPLEADQILAQICISYLILEVFREPPWSSGDNMVKRPRKEEWISQYLKKYNFLEYAAVNWVSHFGKIQGRATNMVMESALKLFVTQSKTVHTWIQIFRASIKTFHLFNMNVWNPSLHIASHYGCETIVDLLLENGADINVCSPKGYTSLMLASSEGHDAVTKLLIEKGANMEMKDSDGDTAVILAAMTGNESIVRLLLKKGANLDEKNRSCETALHLAVRRGHETVVSLLLENEARTNVQDHDGDTVLHFAVATGYDSIVELLLEYNANIDVQNGRGNTALHLAAATGDKSPAQILLRNRASVDVQNNGGNTALHLAVEEGHGSIIQLLLEYNASVNLQNRRGNTALHLAARIGDKSTVQLLIHNHASIDVQNAYGNTALHLAAECGREYNVELLLKNGARHHIPNNAGFTPLDLASRLERSSVIKVLGEYGARSKFSANFSFGVALTPRKRGFDSL